MTQRHFAKVLNSIDVGIAGDRLESSLLLLKVFVPSFNVLVHCVLQGTSLCFYSILAQGLSFVRIHFSFLSAQPTVFFWTSVAGIDTDRLRFYCHADIFRVSFLSV